MSTLIIPSSILIILFAVVGIIDGIYFHLWKYRLYARQDSFQEHLTHTIRAILFPMILYFLYAENFGGYALWAGVAAVLADLAVETWDVLIEFASRRNIGGLSTPEYWVHVNATSLRVAAIALALAAKPISAWSLSSPLVLSEPYAKIAPLTVMILMPGAVGSALLHIWLTRAQK